MAKFLRQGATHKVVLGPAVAVGDGFTPVTTLALSSADEAEAILHDNGTVVDISGYTWAAITTADGYYHLTLQSGISGTVGHLTVVVNDDSLCLPLREDFVVLEEAVYDALFAASAVGPLLASSDGSGLTEAGGTGDHLTALATQASVNTAQSDLDILTGTDGATLATAQANYAPAKAGDLMGLSNDAITAAKYDETTAFPLAAADTGATAIFRTGADADTGETLSDEIAAVQTAADAAQTAAESVNTKIGTPIDLGSGADLSSNAVDIEAQADDIAAILALLDPDFTTVLGNTNDLANRLTAALATKLAQHSDAVLVVVIAAGATTTSIPFTSVEGAAPSATNDFYNGAVLIPITGALKGQRASIDDYDGGTATATVSGYTAGPATSVVAIIV